jgi:hypothetical protein
MIKLWDVVTGRQVPYLEGHTSIVETVPLSGGIGSEKLIAKGKPLFHTPTGAVPEDRVGLLARDNPKLARLRLSETSAGGRMPTCETRVPAQSFQGHRESALVIWAG